MDKKDFKNTYFRDKAYLLKQASIDRIDSDLDYSIDNVRWIEMRENRVSRGIRGLKYKSLVDKMQNEIYKRINKKNWPKYIKYKTIKSLVANNPFVLFKKNHTT